MSDHKDFDWKGSGFGVTIHERNRGQALENSAEAVIRSVATMLALFTAVLALIGGTQMGLAPISLTLIAVAYGLLIVAGLAATGVSTLGHRLRSSGEISTDVLETWLANWGATDGMAAARDVASLEIGLLKTMRPRQFPEATVDRYGGRL